MTLKKEDHFELNDIEKNKNITGDKWDKQVNDYENYVKEYITHYKKSLKGNSNSLTKFTYYKVKGQELGLKLDKAQQKKLLTDQQVKKIVKIQLKIVAVCCQ